MKVPVKASGQEIDGVQQHLTHTREVSENYAESAFYFPLPHRKLIPKMHLTAMLHLNGLNPVVYELTESRPVGGGA